jgi:hypothetical protein
VKYIPLVLILAIAMVIIAGVVVDGDGKTQSLQQALTIAQGAARAGTNAATGNAVNGDVFNLSSVAAVNAAENYIHVAAATGTVRVAGDRVIVTVDLTYTPKILGDFGFGPMAVRATAAAELIDQN